MILAEFSKFLQSHNDELLTHKTTPLELLPVWVKIVIEKNPKSHVEKIVHKEIMYAQNDNGDSIVVGKSDSGRILVQALIKFAKSYDNYTHSKWLSMIEKTYNTKT